MTVKELVFKYATDGAKAAQRADQNVRESVRQTGRVANREAGKVERWMSRNKRAIQGAAVAALGAATAIISSSSRMNAELSGVRSAFGLLADTIISDLLPNTGSLTESAMKLVTAYREMDGGTRRVISGILAFVGAVLVILPLIATLVASVSTVVGAVSGLAGVLGTVATVGGVVVGAIGSIVAAIGAVPIAIAAVIAAVVAFTAAYLLNWRGTRDKTNKLVGDIIGFIKGLASDALEWGKQAVNNLANAIEDRVNRARDAAGNVRDRVEDRITDIVDSARGWGQDLISELVGGIESRMTNVRDKAEEVAETIREYMPGSPAETGPLSDLDQVGPGMAETVASGMEGSRGRVARGASTLAGSMAPGGRGGGGGAVTVVFEAGAVVVQGTGRSREDGQNVADEVSSELERTLGSRGV